MNQFNKRVVLNTGGSSGIGFELAKQMLQEGSQASTGDLTERLRTEWETNYMAPIILSQMLLPLLKRNKGTIINVSSGLAHIPLSIEPNYCATKAALHSMTKSMRVQYHKVGVRVIEVLYPEVNTLFRRVMLRRERFLPMLLRKKLSNKSIRVRSRSMWE